MTKLKGVFAGLILILFCIGSASGEVIKIVWDANTESDVVGYNVYESATEEGPYTFVANSPFASVKINVTGKLDGIIYYVITAYNTAGIESPYSERLTYTVYHSTPAPPIGGKILYRRDTSIEILRRSLQ